MSASVGIDCGSTACKAALIRDGQVAATSIRPTGWNPRESAELSLAELLRQTGIARDEVSVTATGYGRAGITFADKSVTEITCHALGAHHLLPGVRTVVDIGGQDCKVIALADGKVKSFQMNDKCAAGTGRFLEMTAIRFGVDLDELQTLLTSPEYCAINSTCAVFAETEIVSLLAAGESREAIAGGVMRSIATRAVSLAARVEMSPPVLLTGGLARIKYLREILTELLACPVATSPHAQYAGAIGAAMISSAK